MRVPRVLEGGRAGNGRHTNLKLEPAFVLWATALQLLDDQACVAQTYEHHRRWQPLAVSPAYGAHVIGRSRHRGDILSHLLWSTHRPYELYLRRHNARRAQAA